MAQKILIVDDDPHVIMILSSRLKANGYDVISAGDAIHAMRLARQERPGLILLDMKMPAGDGFTIIQNLKSMGVTASIPVIFVTGAVGEEARTKALEQGAVDLVTKPFNPEELIKKIRNVFSKKTGNDSGSAGTTDDVHPGTEYFPTLGTTIIKENGETKKEK